MVEVDMVEIREDRRDGLGVGEAEYNNELDRFEISGTRGGVEALGIVRYVFLEANEARFPDLPLDLEATDRRFSETGVCESSSYATPLLLSARESDLDCCSMKASSSESEESERMLF